MLWTRAEGADILAEDPRQFARGGLALVAVLLGQQVERAFDAHLLAVHGEGEPGDGLVEEPLPGVAHDAEIVQEFLQLIGELMRFHRADAADDGGVAREIGVLGIHRLERILVEPVQFQREEDQRRGVIRDLLLTVGEEFRPPAIGGQLVIAQPGKGHDPPRRPADRLVAVQAVEQPGRVERVELALVITGELGAGGLEPVEVARELGCILARIEIAQIPFRQIAEVLVARGGIGIAEDGVGHGVLLEIGSAQR